MKTYKCNFWIRIFVTAGVLLILVFGGTIVLIYSKEATLFQRVIVVIGIIFGIAVSYAFADNMKINIDDEKIELFTANTLPIFLSKKMKRKTLFLAWNEIGEVRTNYILYPETPIIILQPKHDVNKKPIEFLMVGMPLQLLKDILSHVPPEAKVYLYPYLKRKIEGKQTLFYIK